jgi:hypothetical protein
MTALISSLVLLSTANLTDEPLRRHEYYDATFNRITPEESKAMKLGQAGRIQFLLCQRGKQGDSHRRAGRPDVRPRPI